MVDLAYPERVRICRNNGQPQQRQEGRRQQPARPMAVIELSLGLTGDMSGFSVPAKR